MTVYKISDETTKEEIEGQFNGYTGNIYFIYEGKKKLHTFIEDIDLDDTINLRLKIACEKSFNYSVNIDEKTVDSLSELLENIDDECKDVILDTEDKNEIAELTQQLVYLGLRLNLYLKDEKINRDRYEKLNSASDELFDKTNELRTHLKTNNVVEQDLKDFIGRLDASMDKIGQALQNSQKRELTLSVMGTKKCGKSMVINSFLGVEYAPTSLELPTPNTVLYQQSEDNKIYLECADKKGYKEHYESAEKINEHLDKLFQQANNAEDAAGKALPDMTIHYDASQTKLANMRLKIADTPGPNLAGANHSQIAEKWIELSDVILYVIDYEKHATKDEIEFLEKVKNEFEKRDKFYSLIILINKTDKVFETKENKSLVRVASLIKEKISNLGFKNSIVIPTTSKAYFYSNVVKHDIPSLSREALEKAEKDFIRDRNKTEIIDFISSITRRLKKYDTESNHDEIARFSNFDFVKNYSFYIAKGKALDELIQNSMHTIESEMNAIVNDYASTDLIKNMGDQKEEIKKIIEDLDNSISEIINALNIENIFDGVTEKILEQYALKDRLHNIINDFIVDAENLLDTLGESELKNMYEHGSQKLEKKLHEKLDINLAKLGLQYIEDLLPSTLYSLISSAAENKAKNIREKQTTINEHIIDANNKLKKAYAGFTAFETMHIDFSFAKDDAIKLSSNKLDIPFVLPNIDIEKEGAWTRFLNYFTNGSDYKLKNKEQFIENLRKSFEPALENKLSKISEDIECNINPRLEKAKATIKSQFKEYSKNLSPVTNALHDMSKDVGLLEAVTLSA